MRATRGLIIESLWVSNPHRTQCLGKAKPIYKQTSADRFQSEDWSSVVDRVMLLSVIVEKVEQTSKLKLGSRDTPPFDLSIIDRFRMLVNLRVAVFRPTGGSGEGAKVTER
jgi:hypothetical protein